MGGIVKDRMREGNGEECRMKRRYGEGEKTTTENIEKRGRNNERKE